jgi:regulator of nucleoside diphosphate kinase
MPIFIPDSVLRGPDLFFFIKLINMKTQLHITNLDHQRLQALISHLKNENREELQYLETLEKELQKALKIEPRKITPEVITMNSEVEVIDPETGRIMVVKLVYPQVADFRNYRLSVLSPLGSALIGYSEGDEIEYEVPTGKKKVRIGKILYQPEANGEFNI